MEGASKYLFTYTSEVSIYTKLFVESQHWSKSSRYTVQITYHSHFSIMYLYIWNWRISQFSLLFRPWIAKGLPGQNIGSCQFSLYWKVKAGCPVTKLPEKLALGDGFELFHFHNNIAILARYDAVCLYDDAKQWQSMSNKWRSYTTDNCKYVGKFFHPSAKEKIRLITMYDLDNFWKLLDYWISLL